MDRDTRETMAKEKVEAKLSSRRFAKKLTRLTFGRFTQQKIILDIFQDFYYNVRSEKEDIWGCGIYGHPKILQLD